MRPVAAALCRDWAAQRPRDFGFDAEIVGGRLASRAGPFAGKPAPTRDRWRLDYQRPAASWSLCFPSTHPVVCQSALLVKMTRIITDLQRATSDQSVGAALCRDWAAQRPRDFGFDAQIVGGRLASRAGPFAGKPAPTGDRWRLDYQRPAASWSLCRPSTHLGPS